LFVAPANISTPEQMRWKPHPLAESSQQVDFLQGMVKYAGAGDPSVKAGCSVYLYSFNHNMSDKNHSFVNSDGDFLLVPQQGTLIVTTECGILEVPPQHVVVIPRGHKVSIDGASAGQFRGYAAEVYDAHFVLPELSIIGTTGLADSRHFQAPTAHYVDADGPHDVWTVIQKFNNSLSKYRVSHCPYDVVGWSGNYVPFKYDLTRYLPINSVSFDHIDPSIFCVMSVLTNTPGMAALDFVIFPPRWGVGEHTFRPPYFHRNCMSEYMGLIVGNYEAKGDVFRPGGSSLHNCMAAHGPDVGCFTGASTAELKPQRIADGTLAFMFESGYVLNLTEWAASAETKDQEYMKCWAHVKAFDPSNPTAWADHFAKAKK